MGLTLSQYDRIYRMASNDSKLGQKIHEHLKELGIETPMHADAGGRRSEDYIASQVHSIMHGLGLDLEDDSLRDTRRRVAKMYCHEVFEGLNYDNFPKCTTVENKFKYDEVVLVRNNIVRSTCEHHLQPIYGRASIA